MSYFWGNKSNDKHKKMAKLYGNTWWGQKWLDALSNIDNSNRLPRGRSYANTGKVKEISIDKQKINAKVQGSSPRPYKVTIGLSPFSKKEKEAVLEIIAENPLFLSKLLNNEMPSELLAELKKTGIYIFPTKWKDMSGSACSCPDHAVPCKHLAAVIYMIANEIDRNPFIIFDLRDFQLLDTLKAEGHVAAKSQQMPIRKLTDLFADPKEQKNEKEYQYSAVIVQQIDFSKLPLSKERLFRLLEKNPLFCNEKDFKNILEDNYLKIQKESKKWLNHSEDFNDYTLKPEMDFAQVVIDREFNYVGFNVMTEDDIIFWNKRRDFQRLNDSLSTISLAQLNDFVLQLNRFIG